MVQQTREEKVWSKLWTDERYILAQLTYFGNPASAEILRAWFVKKNMPQPALDCFTTRRIARIFDILQTRGAVEYVASTSGPMWKASVLGERILKENNYR